MKKEIFSNTFISLSCISKKLIRRDFILLLILLPGCIGRPTTFLRDRGQYGLGKSKVTESSLELRTYL